MLYGKDVLKNICLMIEWMMLGKDNVHGWCRVGGENVLYRWAGGQIGRQMISFVAFVKEERGKTSLIQSRDRGWQWRIQKRGKEATKGITIDGIRKHHEWTEKVMGAVMVLYFR